MTNEELKDMFPLFYFSFKESGRIEVTINKSYSRNYLSLDRLKNDLVELEREHRCEMAAKELKEKYPYLIISKYGVSVGVDTSKQTAALSTDDFDLFNPDHEQLMKLNKLGELIQNSDKLFFCSNCHEVKTKKELVGFVFHGKYCNSCANDKTEIGRKICREIEESKKPGYYS